MKSKNKRSQIVYNGFLIILLCGLTGGFLFDLWDTLPFWLKITLTLVLIGFPIFVVYSILSIPKIGLKEDKLIETSLHNQIEIPYRDIKEINPSKLLNRIYKIGYYYSVQSKEGLNINIPLKIYSNEAELIQEIENKFGDYKKEASDEHA